MSQPAGPDRMDYDKPMSPYQKVTMERLKEEAQEMSNRLHAVGLDGIITIGNTSFRTTTPQYDLAHIAAECLHLAKRVSEPKASALHDVLGQMALAIVLNDTVEMLKAATPVAEFIGKLEKFYRAGEPTGDPIKDAPVRGHG